MKLRVSPSLRRWSSPKISETLHMEQQLRSAASELAQVVSAVDSEKQSLMSSIAATFAEMTFLMTLLNLVLTLQGDDPDPDDDVISKSSDRLQSRSKGKGKTASFPSGEFLVGLLSRTGVLVSTL